MKDERESKAKVILATASLYNQKIIPIALELYLAVLDDLTLGELKAAISHGLKMNEWKYMPRPGEIRAVLQVSEGTNLKLQARKEFEEILGKVRGGKRTGFNLSPAGERALRFVGGANAIAMIDDDKLVFLQRDFEETYLLNQENLQIQARKAQVKLGSGVRALVGLTKQVGTKLSIADEDREDS